MFICGIMCLLKKPQLHALDRSSRPNRYIIDHTILPKPHRTIWLTDDLKCILVSFFYMLWSGWFYAAVS